MIVPAGGQTQRKRLGQGVDQDRKRLVIHLNCTQRLMVEDQPGGGRVEQREASSSGLSGTRIHSDAGPLPSSADFFLTLVNFIEAVYNNDSRK